MKKTAHEKILTTFLLVAALLSANVLQAEVTAVKAKSPASLTLQGYRIGMTMHEVKKLLRKKRIKNYKTGFSDLFVYAPSSGSEIRLIFTCSRKGLVLGTIEFSTKLDADETESVLSRIRRKLLARYGTPSAGDTQGTDLNMCWGRCDAASGGQRLDAVLSLEKDRSLVVKLHDGKLTGDCMELRRRKIGRWLNGWISDVRKFTTGMTMKEAAVLYKKRYQDVMMTDQEYDKAEMVTDYVVKAHDFFIGLDYDSFGFEGEAPGAVVLKFTGGQAGRNSSLNARLYYASLSTTGFTGESIYPDPRQKLRLFSQVYGRPYAVEQSIDSITAYWQQDTRNMNVKIFTSGLIMLEKSDPGLKEAYRKASAINLLEIKRHRFDKDLF